jgi:hypothetical protein
MLTHSEYPYAVFGEFKLRTTMKNIYNSHTRTVGTRWCSWLRHCATSRKVAVSIPDGLIKIFH